jgi:hypothetical protein
MCGSRPRALGPWISPLAGNYRLLFTVHTFPPLGHAVAQCSRTYEVNAFFSIYVILPAALCPGVYSASNKKRVSKAGKCFSGVERGRCAWLTTLPPTVSRFSSQFGILNISQPLILGVCILLRVRDLFCN